MFTATGVVILAGGKSVRMGFPKPYLDVNGKTLLEHIHSVYAAFTDSIHVVMNAEFCRGEWSQKYSDLATRMNIQLNPHPEYGRGFSLQLGLARMIDKSFCFVQNVDNLAAPESVRTLIRKRDKFGYTVPVMNGKSGHPIIIGRPVMDNILAEQPGEFKLNEFLHDYPRTEVAVNDPGIFLNLNTQDEYRNFLSELKR